MKRFNRNQPKQGRQNRNKPNRAEIQIGRRINTYTDRTQRNITYNAILEVNTSTKNYTVDDVSDIRYISFAQILASTEFINMAAVYNNYRIKGLSCTAVNLSYSFGPILYMDVDPGESVGNPTNSRLITDDTVKLFNPKSTRLEVCTWSFPGVGVVTQQWLDTSLSSLSYGQVSFGNVPVTTNGVQFELKLDLIVEFANPK